VVESGGKQVAAHAGLHALGAFVDRLGLGAAISEAIIRTTEQLPLHDRGKVMIHLLLLLAGGGESCADVEHLRAQRALFPDVCSDSTLYRSLRALRPEVVAAVKEAVARVRADVWRRMPSVWRNEGILDFDASLVAIHSENKERTGPTYKGGFGFHPLFACFDGTGETSATSPSSCRRGGGRGVGLPDVGRSQVAAREGEAGGDPAVTLTAGEHRVCGRVDHCQQQTRRCGDVDGAEAASRDPAFDQRR